MTKLAVQDLKVQIDNTPLLNDISLSIGTGELSILLGPNGSGKTTLLRAALGLIKKQSGTSKLNDEDVAALPPSIRAKSIAYLPQMQQLAWPLLVKDIVALGRFAYGSNINKLTSKDRDIVYEAISSCDIEHLSNRRMNTLSGGEKARVHCARTFASRAPLIIADEPVAALDPRHQYKVLDLFKSYVAQGNGALIVLHDLSLAAKYADRLIWLKDGQIVADGSPTETLTPQRLADVYQIDAEVVGSGITIKGAV
ncbi:ABC transporter ATP-binding protein [Hirschia maritima]|uniref:ABC transporter ATP-binding protein n=1 Tax=Hirschia maritima TaxID=1121961 RepID=UPI00035E91F0|nr:ABC transporter ATP-binding protein [Hirschia maritima]